MFNLVTGSYRALEIAFLEDLRVLKQSEPLAEVIVLSPSGRMLNHLQRQLAQAGAYLNIQFLTFYALAERLMAEGPTMEDRVVTEPALYREIIQDFLEGRQDVPFTSRDFLRRPSSPIPKGLTGALASTLKDLQDSGAKVVDCANVAREGHLGDAADGAIPILELNVLMYKVLHDHGLRTGADLFRRAAERARTSRWIERQKAIYLYGFYDLTGVQFDLIQALASHPRASIYFPHDEENPAYRYAEKLLSELALSCKPTTVTTLPRYQATITAWSCSGTHNEIWWTAKKILDLADAGVPFDRMAVVARTLEPYLNTLREVFDAHRIPYALHAEEPVGAYPLIKMAREKLRETVGTETAPWSTHVAWAKNLLTSAIRLPKDATAIEARLWDGLMSALQSLEVLDAQGRPVHGERFLKIIDETFDGLRLPLAPDNVAGVQIMDVMTARGLAFDSVFVLGLNEKLFPRLIREDPFLSDHARSALSSALGCRLGRKMDGFQEEKLLFDLAIHSAKKHLHLSCQRSDDEGKALVVSLYLHDFLKGMNLKLEALPRSWPQRIQIANPATLTPKEISIAYHREDREPDALYDALGWDRALLGHLLESQREIESFGGLGAHDGLIGGNHPLTKRLLEDGLSPQTLKDLAECPFKVFGRKILELYTDEPDAKDGELTHTGRGRLVHKILQSFYQAHAQINALDQIADHEFELFQKEFPDLYSLAWEADKLRIMAMLKHFIPLDLADQAATGFKPTYYEIPLAGEIQGTRLQGRVDRLDIGKTGFKVVDYKTGSGGIKKGESVENAILKGKSFQLPVYLALARTLLESQKNPAAKEGSAVFYRLEEDDAVEDPLTIGPEFWKAHGERFYENLAFLVNNIETGSFYIRPSNTRGYCDWCDYQALCRKEHKPTQKRSENSGLRSKHEDCFSGK